MKGELFPRMLELLGREPPTSWKTGVCHDGGLQFGRIAAGLLPRQAAVTGSTKMMFKPKALTFGWFSPQYFRRNWCYISFMLRSAVTLILLAISVPSLAMGEISEAEYQANFDECWKMLLGEDCDRNMLTTADFRKIENKYSFSTNTATSSPSKSTSSGMKSSNIRNGEPITLHQNATVSRINGQSVQQFRASEVPNNYTGDFIVVDDGSPSSTNNSHRNSQQISLGGRYSDSPNTAILIESPAPIESQYSNSRSVNAGSTTPNPTVYSRPGTEAPIDSAIMGALGAGVLSLSLFAAFWLLKVMVKGGKKAAAVTEKGVNRAREIVKEVGKSEEARILEIDDAFYEQAFREVSSNSPDMGLWVKSNAIAEGNEEKQRATYIRLRAKILYEASKT